MNTNNGWKLAPAAATPEMVKAGLVWLAHFQHMRIADKRNAVASEFEAMLAAAPEAPPLTVTVDPDPRGVSVGVYQGSSCVYNGAHPIPASTMADDGAKECGSPARILRQFLSADGFIAECDIPEICARLRPAAPAAGDARDAITLPIAAARMIRREYLPSNPRRMSHVAVRDAVEQFLDALQAAEAAIATSQQGGE